MPLIRRKIAKRPPHGGEPPPPPPPTSEKCSKKALYTATKLYITCQGGGGRAPTLASTVDAHAWGGGANYVFIIIVEVNGAKDGNLHMHILF